MRLIRRNRSSVDPHASDEELVALWRAGNPDAFDPLFERYAEPVYRYAYRLLGDRDRAQDLCSETFHRAVRSLGSYRGKAFRPWLFSIAHNALIDEFRRAHRSVPLEYSGMLPASGPGPEDEVVEQSDRDDLMRLIDQLPEGERHTLVLRLEGLSVEETAAALGKSKAAVYQSYHRSIVHLGQLMRSQDVMVGEGKRHG